MARGKQRGQAPPELAPAGRTIGEDELMLITRDAAMSCGAQTAVLSARGRPGTPPEILAAWGTTPFTRTGGEVAARQPRFVLDLFRRGRAGCGPVDLQSDDSVGTAASGELLTHAAGATVRPPSGPPMALCLGFARPPGQVRITLWKLERYIGLAALGRLDERACTTLLQTRYSDGLTGLLNYAAIYGELEREIARAERHGHPLSCCFVDLDRFKHVNDQAGHLHGSAVLAEVAATLSHIVRTTDIVGRYGGDEFVVVLPDTDYEQACRLAQRLRLKVARSVLPLVDTKLDASVGVAEWAPGQSPDELLAGADEALRDAKRRGGGAVVGLRSIGPTAG